MLREILTLNLHFVNCGVVFRSQDISRFSFPQSQRSHEVISHEALYAFADVRGDFRRDRRLPLRG